MSNPKKNSGQQESFTSLCSHSTWRGLNFNLIIQVISKEVTCNASALHHFMNQSFPTYFSWLWQMTAWNCDVDLKLKHLYSMYIFHVNIVRCPASAMQQRYHAPQDSQYASNLLDLGNAGTVPAIIIASVISNWPSVPNRRQAKTEEISFPFRHLISICSMWLLGTLEKHKTSQNTSHIFFDIHMP